MFSMLSVSVHEVGSDLGDDTRVAFPVLIHREHTCALVGDVGDALVDGLAMEFLACGEGDFRDAVIDRIVDGADPLQEVIDDPLGQGDADSDVVGGRHAGQGAHDLASGGRDCLDSQSAGTGAAELFQCSLKWCFHP
ncbi:hypothetical protein CRH09_15325 [Nocardia terpenica]|uniref:Uncharacterized protein n=1 Tax=Nocardia terpenica TaxID=455432 RepID=A0A291RIE6_9NOCA|nr:hypothetical protein CRH09_15325 [Nocardia terpenica]